MTEDHFAKGDAPAAHFAESDQQGSDATHFATNQSGHKSGRAKLFWVCVIAGVLCLVAAVAILVYTALEYGIPIYYSGILWSN